MSGHFEKTAGRWNLEREIRKFRLLYHAAPHPGQKVSLGHVLEFVTPETVVVILEANEVIAVFDF